jgi:2,3-bisphosphoglycerate-dependent phosphoglycerate mutase
MNEPGLTIHLVRHGQTDWNREQRTQGWTDIPLNALGVEQARWAADELAGRPIGAVIASDLSRARSTAEPIAAAAGVDIVLEPAIRERGFGVAEGLTDAEIERAFAGRLEGRWTDPDFSFEGGESRRQVWSRVTPALAALIAAPPADEIVVVAHGGSLRAARAYLTGLEVDDMPRWDGLHFRNGEIVTIAVAGPPESATEQARLTPPA